MRQEQANAFFASLFLHGAAVGLVVFMTFYAARKDSTPPVIFELVAGPPTDRDALVAPAKGEENPVKLEVPTKAEVVKTPEPPITETVKTETPPVKEEMVPPPTKEAAKTKPTDAAKQIVRDLKKSERMSYKDYLKKHPIPKEQPQTTARTGGAVPRINAKGIAEGVVGGSTASKGGGGGKALTREEQSELNTYISFLVNALREAHEPPPGVNDKLQTEVTFDITASGNILNPRISHSSGNREFDESVLAAFRRVGSIGPVPTGKGDTWKITFRMREPE
jgi:colicin import membrane protein